MKTNHIDKLAWIHIVDRKLLSTISKGKDIFYIPGGKREPGETDEQALVREVKEELSVNLDPETVNYFGTYSAQAHGKPLGVHVQMTCYTAKYSGEIKPSSEIERFLWVTYKDKEGSSPVDQIILDDLRNKNLID